MAHSHYCVKEKSWLYAIMNERKPQDQDKFVLRLPDGMRERIKAEADKNGRSMNAEIVALLERHYPTLPTMEEMLESTGHMAFRISEMLETSKGDLDVYTQRAARSFLDSLVRLQEKLPPKER